MTEQTKAQGPVRILWNEELLVSLLECVMQIGAHLQHGDNSTTKKKRTVDMKWREVNESFFMIPSAQSFKHLNNGDGRKFKEKFHDYKREVSMFMQSGNKSIHGGRLLRSYSLMKQIIDEQEAEEAELKDKREFRDSKKERLFANENAILSGGGGGDRDDCGKPQQKKLSGPGKRKNVDGSFDEDTWASNLIRQRRGGGNETSSTSNSSSNSGKQTFVDPFSQLCTLEVLKLQKEMAAPAEDNKNAIVGGAVHSAEDKMEELMNLYVIQTGFDIPQIAKHCLVKTDEGILFLEELGIELLINQYCTRGVEPRFGKDPFMAELKALDFASTEVNPRVCSLKLFVLFDQWRKEITKQQEQVAARARDTASTFTTPGAQSASSNNDSSVPQSSTGRTNATSNNSLNEKEHDDRESSYGDADGALYHEYEDLAIDHVVDVDHSSAASRSIGISLVIDEDIDLPEHLPAPSAAASGAPEFLSTLSLPTSIHHLRHQPASQEEEPPPAVPPQQKQELVCVHGIVNCPGHLYEWNGDPLYVESIYNVCSKCEDAKKHIATYAQQMEEEETFSVVSAAAAATTTTSTNITWTGRGRGRAGRGSKRGRG